MSFPSTPSLTNLIHEFQRVGKPFSRLKPSTNVRKTGVQERCRVVVCGSSLSTDPVRHSASVCICHADLLSTHGVNWSPLLCIILSDSSVFLNPSDPGLILSRVYSPTTQTSSRIRLLSILISLHSLSVFLLFFE